MFIVPEHKAFSLAASRIALEEAFKANSVLTAYFRVLLGELVREEWSGEDEFSEGVSNLSKADGPVYRRPARIMP
jgi:hypothetical protein